jgi:hypothetical protein
MGPTSGLLDQRQFQRIVDRAQTADPNPEAKLVEHTHIGHSLPVGQPRKGAPSPLFGQQGDQLVDGVGRRQNGEQMGAP